MHYNSQVWNESFQVCWLWNYFDFSFHAAITPFFWFDTKNKKQTLSPEEHWCLSRSEFSSTLDIQNNWTYWTPTKFAISDGRCAVNLPPKLWFSPELLQLPQ